MGQKWVRGLIDDGLKSYKCQDPDDAVAKWKRAVAKASDKQDRFEALGYLAWAHCEWGKYRDMLQYSVKQIDLANEANNGDMRALAYLNLARSNEKLCEYHKAISYCRHALSQATNNNRTIGQVYLCLGNAYVGFSDYQKAFEYIHKSLQLAQKCQDKSLECNAYGSLGDLYLLLKDYDKALQFHLKGVELVNKFGDEWCPKFHTLASEPGRSIQEAGKLNVSLECTEDAMKLALHLGDRSVQSRCLCLFADIHRDRRDYERALPRYEAALNISTEIGDKIGQIRVLSGMAKNMMMRRQYCQALEYNHRALEIAETVGNRMKAMRIHWQLEKLYNTLGQYEEAKKYSKMYKQGIDDLGLSCGICNESIAEKQTDLEPLQCWHLFHANCLESYSSVSKGCPDCRRTLVKPVFV
ncbi:LOW QUALITY PROTEIN: 43 kDa receptor-associated protein of the synapse-like [Ptychodera flava]|uniref:LOW QUALITY PROTEIN: 43 kDa receptor-associated protein of the synapse-like n=1 Tax=Ptychodera flava TaxID=63121 RepID=UPI003969FC92